MIYTEKDRDSIIMNLKDAGCDETEIREIMDAVDRNDRETVKKLVERHREVLLRRFNESKKCIDCIDYFTYRYKKA